jgi:hypothetical protein
MITLQHQEIEMLIFCLEKVHKIVLEHSFSVQVSVIVFACLVPILKCRFW